MTTVLIRKGLTPELRECLARPLSEGELTKCATSCATPEIKLTGPTRPVNATHELLLEYARTRATTAPSGTIRQFSAWWEYMTGYLIPARTFERHTSVLRKMGLVEVRYSRDKDSPSIKRTWYNLIGIGLVMPSMTVARGVIGFEAHGDRAGEQHLWSVAMPADIDLDQLQAEWCGESCCCGRA